MGSLCVWGCCLEKRCNLKTSHGALRNWDEPFSHFLTFHRINNQFIMKIIGRLIKNESDCSLQPYKAAMLEMTASESNQPIVHEWDYWLIRWLIRYCDLKLNISWILKQGNQSGAKIKLYLCSSFCVFLSNIVVFFSVISIISNPIIFREMNGNCHFGWRWAKSLFHEFEQLQQNHIEHVSGVFAECFCSLSMSFCDRWRVESYWFDRCTEYEERWKLA